MMKSFIFLFCTTVFSLNPDAGFSQNAEININEDKIISVEEIFELIKSQTEYNFVFRPEHIQNAPDIYVKKGNIKAYKLLKRGLDMIGCTYDFTDNTVIVKRKMHPILNIPMQETFPIEGTVKDKDGNPIPGATVFVTSEEPAKGFDRSRDYITRGTSTDFDGKFKIDASLNFYLGIVALGSKFKYMKITSKNATYDIVLEESEDRLDEVVVVGYGTTVKKDLTGSVTTLKAKEIEQVKTQTVERALYGKVPGVMVTGTGKPGAAANVVIRGLSQINGDNQPLYVIDGIPININPNSRDANGLLQGSRSNPLLSINPADIENITILKDASAAGIYGSRAANGVIIVKTKRGNRGAKPRFTFSTNTTFQNPQTKYEFLTVDEYKEFYTEQAGIAGVPVPAFGDANTDWQEEVRNKNAMWNDYSLSLSGGTDRINYYVSGNVQNQEAIFINSKFKRYSMAANLDADVTDKLRVGVAINYNNSIDKSSDVDNLRYPGAFRPDVPVFDDAGNYTDNGGLPVFGNPDMNPVGQDGRIRNNIESKNIRSSVYAELELIKNLKFRTQFSANQSNDDVSEFLPSFTIQAALDGLNSNLFARGGTPLGILTTQFNKSKNIIFTNTLTYNTTIKENHRLSAVAGLSWDSTENEATGVSFAGFPDDFVLVNPASASQVFNGNSDFAQKALNSLFGRVNYNYDDKYLLTLTGRADRSTQFGEDNRTGFFPSFGLAWNMHNENFLKDNATITQMKLRVSAGKTGNDNLPAFLFRPVMAVESGFGDNPTQYNGLNGFRLQGVSNQDIRWEETNQLDIALEFGLFNNRLNAEIVWFDKATSDLILLTPLSAQTGFPNYYSNVADVSNKGWEFLVGGDVVRNENFTWNSSFNVSFIKSNVDALKGGQANEFGNYGVTEGYPLGTIFGRDIIKTADTQAEIDALNASAPDGQYDPNLLAPGDFIARDVDGDGEYTTEDDVRLADGNVPDFFGGWNNTMSYKGFDISFNFQFVQGIDKIRRGDEFLAFIDFDRMPNYQRNDLENAWTPDNLDSKFPRAGSRSWQTNNSRFVSDASYVSLRSASIGYNLPSSLLDKVGLSNAKFTLTGNNLFLIHNYAGPNPESILRGVTNTSSVDAASDGGWGYPNVRSFTLGLNVTF
ncbi:TonB-dependent receptor [Flavobacteriaceae bacterium F08102]|nr:TonB-dependent receptor [Flavobacteriaceae bacterium F08102]